MTRPALVDPAARLERGHEIEAKRIDAREVEADRSLTWGRPEGEQGMAGAELDAPDARSRIQGPPP